MLHFSESFEDFATLQKSVELKLLNFFDFFWHIIQKEFIQEERLLRF